MRPIDADKLRRKVQRAATEAWKMKLTASIETILNQFIDYLNEAPTVDGVDVMSWITDRMSEEDGVYLVYAPSYRGGSSSSKENHKGIMFSKFKNGKWSIEHGYYNREGCVKAWMPLPENPQI